MIAICIFIAIAFLIAFIILGKSIIKHFEENEPRY